MTEVERPTIIQGICGRYASFFAALSGAGHPPPSGGQSLPKLNRRYEKKATKALMSAVGARPDFNFRAAESLLVAVTVEWEPSTTSQADPGRDCKIDQFSDTQSTAAGCQSSMGLPSGSSIRANRPASESHSSRVSTLISAASSCLIIASKSATRKLIIHC